MRHEQRIVGGATPTGIATEEVHVCVEIKLDDQMAAETIRGIYELADRQAFEILEARARRRQVAALGRR